ncbi:hypothetical protein SAMN04488118_11756 [Epibacterium ulvae]|uniref:DUF192 domain-containing protein n=1 Tax=Epibacterium ulvae TaxID=1156985 RepID=A0A1G5RHI0_9RHOB|nr:DUF192 domain-containing protein [Epibacterium ulvae]SCZ73545.1 hypothetical protein SAMN04488118_11756 [Epibacterium ulvae]
MDRYILVTVLAIVSSATNLTACPSEQVVIETSKGAVIVEVEIADNAIERAQGLSGRDSLEPGNGMLFLYKSPHRAWFWMKGAKIALDIIFIDPEGTISAIKRNVQPGTYWPISGGANTLSVLEINGGEADIFDIQAGDHVYPLTLNCDFP